MPSRPEQCSSLLLLHIFLLRNLALKVTLHLSVLIFLNLFFLLLFLLTDFVIFIFNSVFLCYLFVPYNHFILAAVFISFCFLAYIFTVFSAILLVLLTDTFDTIMVVETASQTGGIVRVRGLMCSFVYLQSVSVWSSVIISKISLTSGPLSIKLA